MDGYGPTTYGDGFADVYDEWYADVSPPAETASFVAARVDGLLVELGSGTGRLLVPLAATGVRAIGLDASLPMLARSRTRASEVPVVTADMAEQPFRPGCAGGVLIAFNTLFNLPTSSLQRRALGQARDLLAEEGVVVVEAFVPGDTGTEASRHVEVARIDHDVVVLQVSETDPVAGTVRGHHVELRDGAPVRLRPWQVRYSDPAGLDQLAAAAGLQLVERYADWQEAPFDDTSAVHVSVYRHAQRPR